MPFESGIQAITSARPHLILTSSGGRAGQRRSRASQDQGGLGAPLTRLIEERSGNPGPPPVSTHARKGSWAARSSLELPQPVREASGAGPRKRPEACQLPIWWRRRQGGRCHMAKQPVIFRAAPPAEHERRKCRGAAFPVPAAAPAGYIICRGGPRSPTSGFPAPPGCAEPCDTVRCRRLPSEVR